MRLAVLKEHAAAEMRVAATPDTVKKLVALGLTVAIETGAGQASSIPDTEFQSAGAEIVPDAHATLSGAGVVFAVGMPGDDVLHAIPRGALLVCTSGATGNQALVHSLAEGGIDVAAMELLPRITRAQSMDVLSSQANLAGYRAVIEGAATFDRGFPMMMTAAGTVPPARVFVIGAGVAGLQAIATARRLGAIVSATDVRPAAKEEIKSLGATYVGVEDEETAGQTGAYAKEMSDAFRQKQAELMATTVAKNDLVICTALVQGRKAPVIVSQAMVDAMRPGSVVVDLAAEAGGNCAATVPGEIATTANGVKVVGWTNWPARIPVAASNLYARNLLTFLTTFWDKDGKKPALSETDEIVRGVMLTRGGAVVHANFQGGPPVLPRVETTQEGKPPASPVNVVAASGATPSHGVSASSGPVAEPHAAEAPSAGQPPAEAPAIEAPAAEAIAFQPPDVKADRIEAAQAGMTQPGNAPAPHANP